MINLGQEKKKKKTDESDKKLWLPCEHVKKEGKKKINGNLLLSSYFKIIGSIKENMA